MVKRRNNRARRTQAASRGNNRGVVVQGKQELAQITLGTPSGTFVGGQLPLIPTFEPGSRLSNLAVQYSQYSILVSRVEFVSQTTTNTSGRLTLAWTFDPLESTPVSCHQILQVSASRMTPVWRNITTAMPRRSPEKRRFAVIEGPQFDALSPVDKQIYLPATLVFGSDGSAQSGLVVGSLIWHYKIIFFNPNFVIGASTSTTFATIALPTFQGPAGRFVTISEGWEEEEEEQHTFDEQEPE